MGNRGPKPQNMGEEAERLGFTNEKEMLHRYYTTEGLTLPQLSSILGYSKAFIRRRLVACEISRRPAGGNQVKHVTFARRVRDAAAAEKGTTPR